MAEAVAEAADPAPPEVASSEVNLPVGEGGGALSPLSGAYLLVVLSEPMSESHKKSMIQKLRQGKINLSYHISLPRLLYSHESLYLVIWPYSHL